MKHMSIFAITVATLGGALIFGGLARAQDAQQEVGAQSGGGVTEVTSPTSSGGVASGAAAAATGAAGREPDFTWVIPVELRDIAPNTVSIELYCAACSDDCTFYHAGETENVVTQIGYRIELPNPAPREYRQTLTLTSSAGFISEDGKLTAIKPRLAPGEALNWICDLGDIMCRTDSGEIVDDPGRKDCGKTIDKSSVFSISGKFP